LGQAVNKVIYINNAIPAYDIFWNEPRPQICWDTFDGNWVGIWGHGWADLIGCEVLKLTDDFKFEVWQPDLRADKLYCHTFACGLVHKLFPAVRKAKHYGLKVLYDVVSPSIYENLREEVVKNHVVIRLGASIAAINSDILRLSLPCPVIMQCFGEFKSPLSKLPTFKKNILGKIHDIRDHLVLKEILGGSDVITYTSEFSKRNLERYYKGEKISLSIGIDFDYWSRRKNKSEIRDSLGLNDSQKMLFSSSRLNSLKQVDKVIDVLGRLDGHNFLFVVTGHGDEHYEQYLRVTGKPLMDAGRLRFVGHVSDERLVDLYNAADLFIMSSLSEAGPTGTIKAMAMEVPVFSTDTGQMAEVLLKYGAGVIVPRKDYKIWERELRDILNGKEVKIIDREIVKKIHHWPIVAAQYIDLYKRLFSEYSG